MSRAAQRNERPFQRGVQIERDFAAKLRLYAKQIGHIIQAFAPTDLTEGSAAHVQLSNAIERYNAGVEPWMHAVVQRMLAATLRRDEKQWQAYSEQIGADLHQELAEAPMAEALRAMEAYQVSLIKGIGEEAIHRLHEQTVEGLAGGERHERLISSVVRPLWSWERLEAAESWAEMTEGQRAHWWSVLWPGEPPETPDWGDLPEDKRRTIRNILKARLLPMPEMTELERATLARLHPEYVGASHVTEGVLAEVEQRARLIARTETARAASVLVRTRAEAIGSTTYRWRTSGDWKVRPSHRACEREDREGLGKGVYRWADPPLTDAPDYHAHPGEIFNCRCVAIPIF